MPKAQRLHVPHCLQGGVTPAGSAPTLTAPHQQPHSSAGQDAAQVPGDLAASSQAQQGISAPHLHQDSAMPGACSMREEGQAALPEAGQQARQFRHCSSLHSVADAAEHSQNGQRHGSARSDGCQAPQHACRDRQHAQQEAESLNAQNAEACVASSRRLEQPTASTGTSRPVPVMHRGGSHIHLSPALSGPRSDLSAPHACRAWLLWLRNQML